MSELEESIKEGIERAEESPLGARVAILVALVATAMALCHIKDESTVQRMERAETRALDSWSFYQAKSTKQHLSENMLAEVALQRALAGNRLDATATAVLDEAKTRYETEFKKYEIEKEKIKEEAEGAEKDFDRWKAIHDEFALADACLVVSIALFGITALTRKSWLLAVGIAIALAGLAFGLAGFLGWTFHPAWLAQTLT